MTATRKSDEAPAREGACPFTPTQQQRLRELDDRIDVLRTFESPDSRNAEFQRLERAAVSVNRDSLFAFIDEARQPALCHLENALATRLHEEGFARVVTPTVITSDQLDRMSVDADNPLRKQVFWVDDTHCLRPMLAPGLYTVSRKLMNSLSPSLRIFEVGSCFRKESEGRRHLQEFTMINLVEWNTPLDERDERLRGFIEMILDAAGISDWHLEGDQSVVYGEGLDAVDSRGLELASSSMGPHRLDALWDIDCSWVGVGFGLERLLESRGDRTNIHRFARSTTYLDGAALNIK